MDSALVTACSRIDDSFGPSANECRGGFDFTLLFEETFLSIIPIALLLVLGSLRIIYSLKSHPKVIYTSLLPIKLVSLAAFAAIQIVLLAFWARPSAAKTRASIPNAVLTVLGSFVLCILSYVEHNRNVQPSFLTNVFLFFTLLFDVARARTLWLHRYNGNAIAVAFTVSVAVKTVLLVLESMEKRRFLRPDYATYPLEATSGIFNRSFFWWVNSLLRRGFSKLLLIDDLYVLDKHLRSDRLRDLLWSAYVRAIVPRLCLIAFNFCQPFLIQRAIGLADEPITSETTNFGYGMIGAYVLVYVGISVSTGQYQQLTYRAITMARGALVSMLYGKTTELGSTAVDASASLTLMNADIERIYTGWQTMHEIWANCIEIGIAMYLLERQLGIACTIPIGVALVSLLGSLGATSLVIARQALWLQAIERRIGATSTMLAAMKGVKMCGLTDSLLQNLHQLRVDEMRIAKKFRALLIWNLAFAWFAPVIAPVLTFAAFSSLAKQAGNRTTLDASRVFTSLSLFALLQQPLGSLVMSSASFMGAVGSFRRIQSFLDADAHEDFRKGPLSATSSESCLSLEKRSPAKSASTLCDTESEEADVIAAIRAIYPEPPSAEAFEVCDGSFGWDKEKEPILRGINLTIPPGRLTIIIGPVGCGKSTLLKSLLGEVPVAKGAVTVPDFSIAYCDQAPWHMNGTIRESVVGFSQFNQQWYDSVIGACALDVDLSRMPYGDQTMIGTRGIVLSGGQGQRVALARTIYARKNIAILDDIFSGLDRDTENHVFHNLFGRNGLFRRYRTTVVMASSAVKRIPFADHIVALDSAGEIAEQGTFEELNATGGYVSKFNLPKPDWKSSPKQSQGVIQYYGNSTRKAEMSKQALEAEASRQTGDVSMYIYYAKSVGWLPVLIFAVAIVGFVFCYSFPNIWVKWWATSNAKTPNARLGYYLGVYVVLGVLSLLCLMFGAWQMLLIMIPKSGEHFHFKLLNIVLSAPMSFFATTDIGITLNRFSQDLQLIDMELPLATINTFATFVLCIAQMALISVASVYAAIAFPLFLVLVYLIQKFYLRTSRQLRFLDIEAKSPLYSQFFECLNGITTIRAFGWQRQLQEKNLRLLDRSQRPFYLLWSVQRWLTVVLDLVVAAIAVMLIVLVVTLRGKISAGYVGVAMLNVILFSQSIKMLVTFWTTLETQIGAVARIKVFAENAVPEDLPEEKNISPQDWPLQGSINFNNVSAAYRENESVIKDISLCIKAGEKIGICGRTGSGKSSLIQSLFRMIEITDGLIIVDGLDISKIRRQEIRSRLIGVPQDPYFLCGSVRLNADPTNVSSDIGIVDALKKVQLWTVVKEKGGLDADMESLFLSHGQKQLFCLARAMVRPSKILVLDEATSSIDAKTDALMQRVIREKFSTHTIIAVAHKLETIVDFDRIVVLDGGEVVEVGEPYDLLAKPESAFSKLYYSSEGGKDDEDDGMIGESNDGGEAE
ncbi:hypothetical protein K469DRAFT_755155 [Zopfia rhizophila CBS 207.26]|uniref:P-loop containing nucleoside triphosphate hydrolase protein n=1 Tax=Zopfia rhizophila CBS 207.26 TaxID=1314779 RepID=A0A6A6DFX3_9PEZI|nr:hypothetical protein K469DRAFT_755155 [Zopfia rhizophila CBS 207.26]